MLIFNNNIVNLLENSRKKTVYQYFLAELTHIIVDWLIETLSTAYLFLSGTVTDTVEGGVLLTGLR